LFLLLESFVADTRGWFFSLGQDIDHSHPEVRKDLFNWVEWLSSQLRLGGLRLDAIKHFSASFLRDFVRHIDQNVDNGTDWFIVGEYWRADAKVLSAYIEYMNHRMSLFDVPLLTNFYNVSRGILTDVRQVFHGSLAAVKPKNAVVSCFSRKVCHD
jgi:alpha-amylase